ncbi:hypothetical protein [Umezawaea sp. Da 62-37]|uniref:hypothetical protein n=1 Tax=Umezawaea sp. Da 62-37 TaxID=3075927 RepID=UPI0028F6FD65|nr:hypothetical protein [Umezawaea sp. Da 62-37]WNV81920.1 hypothetical protein RM788_27275 [Umezawaea sp. Da 62-37]
MNDLRTLHDAFTELERRADAAAMGMAPAPRPRRAMRLVPVAATVVAVAGLVAGVVLLVPSDSGTQTAGWPSASSTAAPPTPRGPVPHSPDELIARFRVVLGDTATFEVTQEHIMSNTPAPSNRPSEPPPEPGSIVTLSPLSPEVPDASTHAMVGGTLTSAGVTGSFSLVMGPNGSEPDSWCGYSRIDCDVSTLPDGSRLAIGTGHRAPGAVSHLACLKRPDGTMVLMQIGNQGDPSGAEIGSPGSDLYAPQAPLTLDQLKAIVTSDKW